MEELLISHKGRKFFSMPLGSGQFTIGRSPNSSLVLSGSAIARHHAVIRRTDKGLWLTKAEGIGVAVNGEEVGVKGVYLNVRDKIAIASWMMEVSRQEVTRLVEFAPVARPVRLSRPLLIIEDSAANRTYYSMNRDEVTLGSSEDCDVVIRDEFVSRRHAKISLNGRGMFLRDLGSTNGTVVNGVKVSETVVDVPDFSFMLGPCRIRIQSRIEEQEADGVKRPVKFCGMVGSGAAMTTLFRRIERVAATDMTVLIQGATGSGKERVARAIHELSERSAKPLVAVNCGAIAANLVESELFGHEKGAFTGADIKHAGVFEQAEGGTVFLDEIGELPLTLQAKILRVLEYKTFRRVGGTSEVSTNVRVIAATHRDLSRWVTEGKFREDLFYRIFVLPLQVPTLNERMEDLEDLVRVIFHEAGFRKISLSEDAWKKLRKHSWPGNIRELKNVLLRAAAFVEGEKITERDLIFAVSLMAREPVLNADQLREAERIREALDAAGGDKNRAARVLNMGRSTLFRKIRDWKIAVPDDETSSGSGPLIAPQGVPEPLKKNIEEC